MYIYWCFHVFILKERHPIVCHPEEVLSEQVQYQNHGACMFNGEQVNDHIEQDDHADDVIWRWWYNYIDP